MHGAEVSLNDSIVYDLKVAARDGSYEMLSSGIVFDNNTGLEWFSGPDRNTNWKEANAWVESPPDFATIGFTSNHYVIYFTISM